MGRVFSGGLYREALFDLAPAAPEAYVRSFIDEGGALSRLLLQAFKRNGELWETETPALLTYVIKPNAAFDPGT